MIQFDLFSTLSRGGLAALTLATSQLAHAHAHPTTEAPAPNATVAAPAQSVAIDFDDTLEPTFSSIAVTDAAGKAVTTAKSSVDASNRKHMSVALDASKPGVYTVAWVAVASDGHRTHGQYTFTVK